jgi:hypothetical protein
MWYNRIMSKATDTCADCAKSITKVCAACKHLDQYYEDCWGCGRTTLREDLSVCDNCQSCEEDHGCGEYDN